jgi:hypothetical protein
VLALGLSLCTDIFFYHNEVSEGSDQTILGKGFSSGQGVEWQKSLSRRLGQYGSGERISWILVLFHKMA